MRALALLLTLATFLPATSRAEVRSRYLLSKKVRSYKTLSKLYKKRLKKQTKIVGHVGNVLIIKVGNKYVTRRD